MRVLLLPGWQNSGPLHWQSRWETLHGDLRVLQHDWDRPLRGDWMAQLEEAVLATPGPLALAAHSLGCVLAAAWAAHSQHRSRVARALLVAPPDTEALPLRAILPSWAPLPRTRLPFQSRVLASRDDAYCRFERAQALAQDWGAELIDCGARGHLNADSGLGDWPEARAWLDEPSSPL